MSSTDDIFGLGPIRTVDARRRAGDPAQPRTISAIYACDLVEPILQHTAQLFFLLEAAEGMAERVARKEDWRAAHAPAGLSLALKSTVLGETYDLRSEMGSEGRLVQLAYRGWVAMVAGTWERFRKRPPYAGKASGLPMGMQTGVFGDLQKIRNDVLKNGAVAAKGAQEKCEVLKWFAAGEAMTFRLDHVIEFLHLNALLSTGTLVLTDDAGKARMGLAWHARQKEPPPPWRDTPWRVVSTGLFVDRVERADPASDHGLFARLAFADAVTETVLVERSQDLQRLVRKQRAIEAAPPGGLFGLPDHPDLRWDVPVTHARAKARLAQGLQYRGPDSVGPPIRFGVPQGDSGGRESAAS
ncbi:MAG: hypothetical protein F4Y02_10780 [Chloroflexi bacterium]|nr:hypothetical protein [Chloroflexota bacterium]